MTASLTECQLAAALKKLIYFRAPAGCCWHIVLDDGNVTDSDIEWVIANILSGGPHICAAFTRECSEIAPLLRRMSITQRKKLIRGGYR